MINKIKSKIFMIVMISLSVMIISVTFVINIINYSQSRQESYTLIENANNLLKHEKGPGMPPNNIKSIPNLDEDSGFIYWKTTDFYLVILDNNTIVQTINDNPKNYSNKIINQYALQVSKKNKKQGSVGNLIYSIKSRNSITTVTFMDNTMANKRLKSMLILSIIITFIALILTFFISRKISVLLIRPIEDTLNKQKKFISDASHELKTPLAVICANADTLEGEIGSNKWLSYIQNEVGSMNKLVNSLLSLARVENNNSRKDNFVYFDLSKTILGSSMVFESLAFENDIELINDIQENLNLKGINDEIKQVVSILLDNAIGHTEKGGKIIVQLKKYKNNIFINVKNTGEPISKGEEEKIFERFYRSDESRNRDSQRYGLGLSIAKSIVEKHHGKIKVSWESGFTIFTVMF